jgi:GTP-binding protein EngB required for normal cell division
MSTPPAPTEAVRHKARAILDQLLVKGPAFDLPPAPALVAQRDKLADDRYKVLVCGEAKRGKSTFVNALIGQGLLPTAVSEATCQVFHVQHADRPAFRLRFEDDSAQEITAADLARYGSQILADVEGTPRLDQLLRWIEVEVPLHFLPRGVSILDTPGIGTLYAAHAQITHRFVPHADAVIYVLDSAQPLGAPDLEFLESILAVTRNVFFIQTKIDRFRRNDWQAVQKRNEELLAQHLGRRLADGRVWPVSSANLRKAAETGDDDLLQVSRHRELAAGLDAFLFRVCGWSRSAEAVVAAGSYHRSGAETLAARLVALEAESAARRDELRAAPAARRKEFEADWGPRGGKRRALHEGITNHARLAKAGFRQTLASGGELERILVERIDSVTTMEEAQARGNALWGEVAALASEHWRRLARQTEERCLSLVAPLLEEVEAPNLQVPEGEVTLRARTLDLQDDLWARLKLARSEALTASGLGGSAGALIGLVLATSWMTPLGLIGTAVAGLWGLAHGWQRSGEKQVRSARQELRRHLDDALAQLRKHFFHVDLGAGRFNRVDEHFDRLESALLERVETVVAQKSRDLQAESARLEDEARLGAEQRQDRARVVQQQIGEWQQIGAALAEVTGELREWDRSLLSGST